MSRFDRLPFWRRLLLAVLSGLRTASLNPRVALRNYQRMVADYDRPKSDVSPEA